MSTRVSLSPRDEELLRLLSWTPATTELLLRASGGFAAGSFANERRLRERLQALTRGGFVRVWASAQAGGGLQNYYKLTPTAFDVLHGTEVARPPRAFFTEVSPSLFDHTFRLAETIVETILAAKKRGVKIERFLRENELALGTSVDEVHPDCFFRLSSGGRAFSVGFEIDCGTEPLSSAATSSLERKLRVYYAYQEAALRQWRGGDRPAPRPRFRVAFLTRTVDRAHHILSLAKSLNPQPDRRLIYAASLESYTRDENPLHAPLFLDHQGQWQALIDLHPTAPFRREPVRLSQPIATTFGI